MAGSKGVLERVKAAPAAARRRAPWLDHLVRAFALPSRRR